jgi:rod shape-determining protein MreB
LLRSLLTRLMADGPYYLRIDARRLSIRNVRTAQMLDIKPIVVFGARDRLLAVGEDARETGARSVRPFEHPRVVIADYAAAEQLLRYALRRMAGRLGGAKPTLVIHPEIELAGGLSGIETRALVELGAAAGAGAVRVHYGRTLTDLEVREMA